MSPFYLKERCLVIVLERQFKLPKCVAIYIAELAWTRHAIMNAKSFSEEILSLRPIFTPEMLFEILDIPNIVKFCTYYRIVRHGPRIWYISFRINTGRKLGCAMNKSARSWFITVSTIDRLTAQLAMM